MIVESPDAAGAFHEGPDVVLAEAELAALDELVDDAGQFGGAGEDLREARATEGGVGGELGVALLHPEAHGLLDALDLVGEVVDAADASTGSDPVTDDGTRRAVADEDLRGQVEGARLEARRGQPDPRGVAQGLLGGFEGDALGGLAVAEIDGEFLLDLVAESLAEKTRGAVAVGDAVGDVVEPHGGCSAVDVIDWNRTRADLISRVYPSAVWKWEKSSTRQTGRLNHSQPK